MYEEIRLLKIRNTQLTESVAKAKARIALEGMLFEEQKNELIASYGKKLAKAKADHAQRAIRR